MACFHQIEYNHFCQHPQFDKKAKGCKQCKSCSLWTDAEADDRRIIEELKAQGQHEIQELGMLQLVWCRDVITSKKQAVCNDQWCESQSQSIMFAITEFMILSVIGGFHMY